MPTPSVPTLSSHGAQIPAIGFGTSGLGEDCAAIVAHALKVGYRHIDTAQKYGTERGVGEGIRASGVPRAEIFLTTKVSHEYLEEATFERTAEGCLEELGQDYVDLLLVHWPNTAFPLAGTMRALARCRQRGLARHVGVANFNLALLDEAIGLCPEPIVNLQTEVHPYLSPMNVIEGCRRRGVAVTGYCPLGRGRMIGEPLLAEIGHARAKSPAQVALRWALQLGVAPMPRSSNRDRIVQNLDILGFTLSADEMARITALKRAGAKIADPPGRAPRWDD